MSCSNSRNTVDEHGNGPMLHTTGQKPHAGVRLEMTVPETQYTQRVFGSPSSRGPSVPPPPMTMRQQNPIPGESTSDTHAEADVMRSLRFYLVLEEIVVGGGGSGGIIHFHWSDIPTGDVYHHIVNVKGRVYVRKCIYEKITEDEIECCPVCNIDLGGTPLDKLRPDHNLQDLRAKIFPLKGRKVKAPEPARKKERSMSYLVDVTKTKASDQAGRRRTKTVTRKELLQDSASLAEKEEESLLKGHLLESTSSPNKFTQNKKDSDEPWDPESYWKPLNFLVEVANRTQTLKSSSASQGPGSKSEKANASSHKQIQPRVKDHKSRYKREYEKSAKREMRDGPVWFSLVASTDQDGDIPVSFIQKYLMRKLNLQSETEVEIRCMGEAVIPALKLQKLVDLWLHRGSKRQKIDAWIGSSAQRIT
uniref:Uncharacterized protein n=2 Tax=Brassica campestris TaxID=3711 RepID=M4DGA2_BRACM